MPDLDTLLASSMTALLANSETRAAIVDYIKTLTDKQKPTEQWREVWYQQHHEVRLWSEVDPQTGVTGRKCRFVVKAYWDARAKIGMVCAFLTGEGDYSKMQYYYDWMETDMYNIAREVFHESDYPPVITYAQHWIETVYDKWLEKTEPLPEETK